MEGQLDRWMIDRWTSIGKLAETGQVHKVIVLMRWEKEQRGRVQSPPLSLDLYLELPTSCLLSPPPAWWAQDEGRRHSWASFLCSQRLHYQLSSFAALGWLIKIMKF